MARRPIRLPSMRIAPRQTSSDPLPWETTTTTPSSTATTTPTGGTLPWEATPKGAKKKADPKADLIRQRDQLVAFRPHADPETQRQIDQMLGQINQGIQPEKPKKPASILESGPAGAAFAKVQGPLKSATGWLLHQAGRGQQAVMSGAAELGRETARGTSWLPKIPGVPRWAENAAVGQFFIPVPGLGAVLGGPVVEAATSRPSHVSPRAIVRATQEGARYKRNDTPASAVAEMAKIDAAQGENDSTAVAWDVANRKIPGARLTTNILGSIVTDPLTYATFGTESLTRTGFQMMEDLGMSDDTIRSLRTVGWKSGLTEEEKAAIIGAAGGENVPVVQALKDNARGGIGARFPFASPTGRTIPGTGYRTTQALRGAVEGTVGQTWLGGKIGEASGAIRQAGRHLFVPDAELYKNPDLGGRVRRQVYEARNEAESKARAATEQAGLRMLQPSRGELATTDELEGVVGDALDLHGFRDNLDDRMAAVYDGVDQVRRTVDQELKARGKVPDPAAVTAAIDKKIMERTARGEKLAGDVAMWQERANAAAYRYPPGRPGPGQGGPPPDVQPGVVRQPTPQPAAPAAVLTPTEAPPPEVLPQPPAPTPLPQPAATYEGTYVPPEPPAPAPPPRAIPTTGPTPSEVVTVKGVPNDVIERYRGTNPEAAQYVVEKGKFKAHTNVQIRSDQLEGLKAEAQRMAEGGHEGARAWLKSLEPAEAAPSLLGGVSIEQQRDTVQNLIKRLEGQIDPAEHAALAERFARAVDDPDALRVLHDDTRGQYPELTTGPGAKAAGRPRQPHPMGVETRPHATQANTEEVFGPKGDKNATVNIGHVLGPHRDGTYSWQTANWTAGGSGPGMTRDDAISALMSNHRAKLSSAEKAVWDSRIAAKSNARYVAGLRDKGLLPGGPKPTIKLDEYGHPPWADYEQNFGPPPEGKAGGVGWDNLSANAASVARDDWSAKASATYLKNMKLSKDERAYLDQMTEAYREAVQRGERVPPAPRDESGAVIRPTKTGRPMVNVESELLNEPKPKPETKLTPAIGTPKIEKQYGRSWVTSADGNTTLGYIKKNRDKWIAIAEGKGDPNDWEVIGKTYATPEDAMRALADRKELTQRAAGEITGLSPEAAAASGVPDLSHITPHPMDRQVHGTPSPNEGWQVEQDWAQHVVDQLPPGEIDEPLVRALREKYPYAWQGDRLAIELGDRLPDSDLGNELYDQLTGPSPAMWDKPAYPGGPTWQAIRGELDEFVAKNQGMITSSVQARLDELHNNLRDYLKNMPDMASRNQLEDMWRNTASDTRAAGQKPIPFQYEPSPEEKAAIGTPPTKLSKPKKGDLSGGPALADRIAKMEFEGGGQAEFDKAMADWKAMREGAAPADRKTMDKWINDARSRAREAVTPNVETMPSIEEVAKPTRKPAPTSAAEVRHPDGATQPPDHSVGPIDPEHNQPLPAAETEQEVADATAATQLPTPPKAPPPRGLRWDDQHAAYVVADDTGKSIGMVKPLRDGEHFAARTKGQELPERFTSPEDAAAAIHVANQPTTVLAPEPSGQTTLPTGTGEPGAEHAPGGAPPGAKPPKKAGGAAGGDEGGPINPRGWGGAGQGPWERGTRAAQTRIWATLHMQNAQRALETNARLLDELVAKREAGVLEIEDYRPRVLTPWGKKFARKYPTMAEKYGITPDATDRFLAPRHVKPESTLRDINDEIRQFATDNGMKPGHFFEPNPVVGQLVRTQSAYTSIFAQDMVEKWSQIKDAKGNPIFRKLADLPKVPEDMPALIKQLRGEHEIPEGWRVDTLPIGEDGQAIAVAAPEEVIDTIKPLLKISDPSQVMQFYDAGLAYWKAMATVPIIPLPTGVGFHMRNATTNVAMNWISNIGIRGGDYTAMLKLQYKMWRSHMKFGLLSPSMFSEHELGLIERMSDEGTFRPAFMGQREEVNPTVLGQRVVHPKAMTAQERKVWLKRGFSLTPIRREGGRWIPNIDTWWVKSGGRLGEAVETNARMAHFVAAERATGDAARAGASMRKWLFDYGDLSPFEKNVMRRTMPFYTFTRKVIPRVAEGVIANPRKLRQFEIVREALGTELAPAQTQEEQTRLKPHYLDQYPGLIPVTPEKWSPWVRKATSFLTGGRTELGYYQVDTPFDIPFQQMDAWAGITSDMIEGVPGLRRLPDSPQNYRDFFQTQASMLGGPVAGLAKAAAEVQGGRDFFSGAPIRNEPVPAPFPLNWLGRAGLPFTRERNVADEGRKETISAAERQFIYALLPQIQKWESAFPYDPKNKEKFRRRASSALTGLGYYPIGPQTESNEAFYRQSLIDQFWADYRARTGQPKPEFDRKTGEYVPPEGELVGGGSKLPWEK